MLKAIVAVTQAVVAVFFLSWGGTLLWEWLGSSSKLEDARWYAPAVLSLAAVAALLFCGAWMVGSAACL